MKTVTVRMPIPELPPESFTVSAQDALRRHTEWVSNNRRKASQVS